MAKHDTGSARAQTGDGQLRQKPARIGEMLVRAVKDFFADNGPQWAAAIAYYSLLSAFPLLLAVASIAAYFVDPKWAVEQATQIFGGLIPAGQGEIEGIVKGAIDARRNASILSILALLWSGSRVFGTLTKALNIAYDSDTTYKFWKRTLIELIMVLTIGLFFVVALSSRWLISLLWGQLAAAPGTREVLFQTASQVLPALLLLAAFFLIYRFVPRTRVNSSAALGGAVLASVLFILARPLFFYYLQRFGSYNLVYGSLAILVILIVWAWLVAIIVLLGGEVVSHTQEMLIEGQSGRQVERNHRVRWPTPT